MIQRALVAGVGSMGSRHLRLLREALPDTDIRVLGHRPSEERIEYANGSFFKLDEACAFAPEVAIIASPAPCHLETARALAGGGCHLLIEKPLAAVSIGLADFLETCAARSLIVQVGYNLRFLQTLQRFRDELHVGRIGKVHAVRCEIGQYLPDWRPGRDYRTAVSSRRALGGGVLLELSHELDMLRWVFGEIAWVNGWTGQLGDLEIEVEDCAQLTLGFECGCIGSLSMDFLRRDTTRVCTAIAEDGTMRWDAVAGEVALCTSQAEGWQMLETLAPERDSSYRDQIADFLRAVQHGAVSEPAATGHDGLEVVRLVEAVHRSNSDGGRRVVLAGAAAT